MVLKHVVFANPDNTEAKNLLGRQLRTTRIPSRIRAVAFGVSAGRVTNWRNGVPNTGDTGTASTDIVRAMSPGDVVRLPSPCA